MPTPPSGNNNSTETAQLTLAGLLVGFSDPKLLNELEVFRVKYEAKFGETDLTRRYTSERPTHEQSWLLENFPERYWRGLPPFAQAFLKEKMRHAHKLGRLDDMPGGYLAAVSLR